MSRRHIKNEIGRARSEIGVAQTDLSGNRLGIQRMDVLSSGQHQRVADGVTSRARLHVLSIQCLRQGAQLVVFHHLLQAEVNVPTQTEAQWCQTDREEGEQLTTGLSDVAQ
jgi:hypothetical protein